MKESRLIVILGDQLSLANPALDAAEPARDHILLAEVADEASYVPHNRHKLVLIFSAMRHFRDALRKRGFSVTYVPLSAHVTSLSDAMVQTQLEIAAQSIHACLPGEHRALQMMEGWANKVDVPVHLHQDTRFLCSLDEFEQWAHGRKELRMEYFYREMRKKHCLLLDENGKPEGGSWNYDKENRKGWRGQLDIPQRPDNSLDAITREVIAEVLERFPDNAGDLELFRYAVTHEGAQRELDWFCEHALQHFGRYQDGLAEESPWLFHSLVALYLNIGLLEPLAVCQQVEAIWREGKCELAAAEGFIRQILGWREYVRGIYWRNMPQYAQHNFLNAKTPLPQWFWTGDTPLRCMSQAIDQSLSLGYAHHIQRLMVIGNFALLAGLEVEAVCEWYLAVYVDAFEWVELPNTLGMALHADGGIMASKPYAASGKYIQRQGNHCKQCAYDPGKVTGEGACPFNALYWRFIDKHKETFASNARMNLILANWRKRDPVERQAIVDWADQRLPTLLASDA
ncbi:MAG: cryptochrome/photolyase family protein [Halioglobus sp.]